MTTTFTPLPSPFPAEVLEEIKTALPYYSPQDALTLASALRKKGYSPEETSSILTQAKLRTSATAKFGPQASNLLFTEAGYEQATRAAVARLHADRFLAAGITSVADLGCGIGADSYAFASAGLDVVAVERDEFTASLTAHNLAPFKGSGVLCADLTELNLETLTTRSGKKIEALWLDPARREIEGNTTSRRVWDAEAFSPPLSFVLELAASGIPLGVKMGPGIPHDQIPNNCEAQWISHAGSVVEVVLWFNALARPGVRRSATVLGPDALEPQLLAELTSPLPANQSPQAEQADLSTYISEPDGAVIRAHLVSDLAEETGAHLLDEHIAYLSSDHPLTSPLATSYRVLEELPLNEKTLRRWVKEKGITALTIKKRGVDIVPEQLRAKLLAGTKKKKGSPTQEATLIITRLGSGSNSRRLVLAVEPL